jgi:hypothetical protein
MEFKKFGTNFAHVTLVSKEVMNMAANVLYWLIGMFYFTAVTTADGIYLYMKQEYYELTS